MKRLKIRVRGIVQGVGFRPFVYTQARQLQLTGWVSNDSEGVVIEAQGLRVAELIDQLKQNPPTLATVESIETHELCLEPGYTFLICPSQKTLGKTTKVSPDIATCEACLAELLDPASRFYQYPFINCTHCGPRYSIIEALPYDRCHTSMKYFVMCRACQADYDNPNNRRFHAQPIACPDCGPQYSHAVADIAQAIQHGKIIALKNLGGFQLLCDAHNASAIRALRQRKQRPYKAFAVLVKDIETAKQLAVVSKAAISQLTHHSRPIVLLPTQSQLPESIAPGLNTIGVMLPSTPVHHLLFDALKTDALVCTSGNATGGPMIIDNEHRELTQFADLVVTHNRAIVTRVDDSVRLPDIVIRRARGIAPQVLKLPIEVKPTLALGADLKNTICIAQGTEAFVSQHIGDLGHPETYRFFQESIGHLQKITGIVPKIIAHDLHPDFLSTTMAQAFDLPLVAVQHHRAHFASVIAERHLNAPIHGLILDGFGLGNDAQGWGGELLFCDESFSMMRLSHLEPLIQPGGDKAASECWRMGLSVLSQLGMQGELPLSVIPALGSLPAQAGTGIQLFDLLKQKAFTSTTTAMGRYFDAAASVLKVCQTQSYEAEAAMRLESLVTEPEVIAGGWEILASGQLSLRPLFQHWIKRLPDSTTGANQFHGTLIAALSTWLQYHHVTQVVLAGGCFLNAVLRRGLQARLASIGIPSYLPQQLPPNDGGISLGQVLMVHSGQ